MTDSTMRLWRAFEKTDPGHTKPVEFGRKFTSIDAHWQIMRVTEQLGPVGQGWGYEVQHDIETFPGVVTAAIADVTVWWVEDASKSKHYYGPVRGCCAFLECDKDGKPRLTRRGVPDFDDDAPKKATTDALTKALSHLGVSADVFLGLFDDSKYVAKMQREFAAQKVTSNENLPEEVADSLAEIPKCKDLAELNVLADAKRPLAMKWDKPHRDVFALRVNERRLQLTPKIAAAE